MIEGGCYCGKVRFAINGQPRVLANCHCETCRRAAGAQAVAWTIVKRSDFEWKTGEPHRYKTDTGAFRLFAVFSARQLTYKTDPRPNESDAPTPTLTTR